MTQKNISFCILDSDQSFMPIEYHACCDKDRDSYDKNLFKFIGAGVIFMVSDVVQPTAIYKNFYLRINNV